MWIPIFTTVRTYFDSECFTAKAMNWEEEFFYRR